MCKSSYLNEIILHWQKIIWKKAIEVEKRNFITRITKEKQKQTIVQREKNCKSKEKK